MTLSRPHSKRNWLLCTAAFLATILLLLPIASVTATESQVKRPNVLWIIAEDMGPELACYGHPAVSTPNLDQMASDGVRYAKAYTVTPVCSTSRSSFNTGMHACSIGAHQHRTPEERKQPLPDGVRLLTGWLHDAGYFTANVRTIEEGLNGTGKTDWNFTFPAEDSFQGNKWAELKPNQPFYAQINLNDSHRGWSAPERADPAKVKLPPYYPDHPVARADWAKYLDEIMRADESVGRILAKLEADGLADDTIVAFIGDNGQAHVRGKQWCYESGLRVPLIIRWAKNFPLPAGFERGKVDERLVTSIDLAATTLVAMAGAPKPPKMQGRVLLGDHQDPPNQYVFGTRDRCDMTTFHIRTARDARYRYIRNFMPEKPFLQWNAYKERGYPMIALMRELHAEGKLNDVQAVLLADHRPAEELYDLESDPYEIHNLAGDPRHADKLSELRGALEQWMQAVGDQGPEPPEVQAEYQEIVDKKLVPERPDRKAKKK